MSKNTLLMIDCAHYQSLIVRAVISKSTKRKKEIGQIQSLFTLYNILHRFQHAR